MNTISPHVLAQARAMVPTTLPMTDDYLASLANRCTHDGVLNTTQWQAVIDIISELTTSTATFGTDWTLRRLDVDAVGRLTALGVAPATLADIAREDQWSAATELLAHGATGEQFTELLAPDSNLSLESISRLASDWDLPTDLAPTISRMRNANHDGIAEMRQHGLTWEDIAILARQRVPAPSAGSMRLDTLIGGPQNVAFDALPPAIRQTAAAIHTLTDLGSVRSIAAATAIASQPWTPLAITLLVDAYHDDDPSPAWLHILRARLTDEPETTLTPDGHTMAPPTSKRTALLLTAIGIPAAHQGAIADITGPDIDDSTTALLEHLYAGPDDHQAPLAMTLTALRLAATDPTRTYPKLGSRLPALWAAAATGTPWSETALAELTSRADAHGSHDAPITLEANARALIATTLTARGITRPTEKTRNMRIGGPAVTIPGRTPSRDY